MNLLEISYKRLLRYIELYDYELIVREFTNFI